MQRERLHIHAKEKEIHKKIEMAVWKKNTTLMESGEKKTNCETSHVIVSQ